MGRVKSAVAPRLVRREEACRWEVEAGGFKCAIASCGLAKTVGLSRSPWLGWRG